MALEIERRFLLNKDFLLLKNPLWFLQNCKFSKIRQGYLSEPKSDIVARIRQIDFSEYTLTLKSHFAYGTSNEVEFPIGSLEFLELWEIAKHPVHKDRYLWRTSEETIKFEIDVFRMEKFKDVAIIEVELPSIDHEIELPEFVGTEITGNRILSNLGIGLDPEGAMAEYNKLMQL